MKKILTLVLPLLLAAGSLRADLIWYEPFSYADGDLPIVSSGAWVNFSGATPLKVYNSHLEVSSGSAPASRDGDEYRLFTAPYTNSTQVLYASFLVACTNLPNAAGTYFASFYGPNVYYGRIWARTCQCV